MLYISHSLNNKKIKLGISSVRGISEIGEELFIYEKTYGVTTQYMLTNKVDIEERVVNDWINLYETYLRLK